jgi:Fe-S cluster assembly protein SufD
MTTAFTPDAARDLGGPGWLVERRLRAVDRLADLQWPSASEEIWRYSRIDEFDLDRYRPVSLAEIGEPGVEGAPGGGPWAAEVGKVGGLLVVRDGRVVHHVLDPALVAAGVRVCGLATCDRDDEALRHLGSCTSESEDAFTVLHDAFLPGGALVSVPAGVVVPDPIVVLHWSEGDGEASFPHTLVVAGDNSEVTVLERTGSPHTSHLVVGAVELIVGAAARVAYLSVQQHGAQTWSIATQRARVGADGSLRSAAIALGGDYARLRSESTLAGRGAESNLLAVYFGDYTQMLDFRTLQDHAAPNTHSNLLFKGAVEDEARSVYSGMIRIREDAAKAEAYQTNRNLVLTEGAGAESIPNLEILNNDVKCSHASAVGSIDPDQLYYLESRGVPPEEAERLIVLGFFDDVLDRLPLQSLTASLRSAIVEKIEHRRARV